MAEFDNKKYVGSYKIFNQKLSTYKEINKRQIYDIRVKFFPDEAHLLQEPEEEIIDLEEERRKEHNIRVNLYFHKYPDYNYCKLFKLEGDLEETTFNKKYNTDRLRWVLWNTNNMTDKLISTIKKRIFDNSNIIIIISGTPNSGKSEIAQTIAKLIKYLFKTLKGMDVNSHIVFSNPEFYLKLPSINEGDLIIRDETPETTGTGSMNMKKNLENVLKAIRILQNSFIFVSPIEIKSNMPIIHIITAGKYKSERVCRGIIKDKEGFIGHIYVPLHNDEKIRDPYIKRKKDNVKSLLDHAGINTIEPDMKLLKRDIENLYEWCRIVGVYKKNELLGEIEFYNDTIKDSEKIKGSTGYKDMVINKTWADIKKAKNKGIFHIEKEKEVKKEKIEEQNKLIIPIEKEDLKDMPFNIYVFKVLKGALAIIGRGLSEGKSYQQIDRTNKDITSWNVEKTAKQLRTGGGKYRLGYLFEDYYALKLGAPAEFLSEIVPHNDNRPDIDWDGKLYSIKYRIDDKHKTLTFSQSKDCKPEYEEAKKRGINYFFVFTNPKWSKEVLIKKIDPINNGDKIICTPGLIRIDDVKKIPER